MPTHRILRPSKVTWSNILSSLADFQCVPMWNGYLSNPVNFYPFKCLFKVQIMSGDNTFLIFHFISILFWQCRDGYGVDDARDSSVRILSEACWCLHEVYSFVNIQVNIVLDYEWAVIQQWLVWKQWVWLLFRVVFKLSIRNLVCIDGTAGSLKSLLSGTPKIDARENPGNVCLMEFAMWVCQISLLLICLFVSLF